MADINIEKIYLITDICDKLLIKDISNLIFDVYKSMLVRLNTILDDVYMYRCTNYRDVHPYSASKIDRCYQCNLMRSIKEMNCLYYYLRNFDQFGRYIQICYQCASLSNISFDRYLVHTIMRRILPRGSYHYEIK